MVCFAAGVTAHAVPANFPGFSVTGYLPAENPKLMGLVIVDDAKIGSSANYGGLVAAPVFSKIGAKAARYLDLPAEEVRVTAQSGTTGGATAAVH